MIAKVTRGGGPGGAVRYLFSAGRHNEHEDPHVVAAAAALDVSDGWRPSEAELKDLEAAMEAQSALYGNEEPRGVCWHLALSTKGGVDRDLSDEEWAAVAREALCQLGFDTGDCRWVAVRHGRSGAGNDHMHLVVNLVGERREGRLHPQRLQAPLGPVRRHGAPLRARCGRGARHQSGDAGAHPGRGGKGTPHRTGGNRTGRAGPGGARCGHCCRQRSRLRAVAPGRRAGGQAPLRPRRRAWRGRLRGGRGPLRRGVAVFFGGGKLARDLSLPALRDRWRDGEGERQEAAAEWAGDAPTTGVHDVPRPSRHLTHGWAEASERWSKTSLREEHQPSAQHYAGGWRAATQSLGEVVHRLGAVPAEDVATWRAVASDAAGVLAVVLGRLERSPGPLARASGLLARSAQGPRQDAAKPGYVPRGTIKSVAALMAQADLDEDTPTAWRLLLAEVLRVAQAVHDAHLARSESEQAGRLAGEARKALEKARARLGSLEALRAELPAVVDAAHGEAGPAEEEAAKRRRHQAGKGGLRPEQFAGTTTRRDTPKRSSDVGR